MTKKIETTGTREEKPRVVNMYDIKVGLPDFYGFNGVIKDWGNKDMKEKTVVYAHPYATVKMEIECARESGWRVRKIKETELAYIVTYQKGIKNP